MNPRTYNSDFFNPRKILNELTYTRKTKKNIIVETIPSPVFGAEDCLYIIKIEDTEKYTWTNNKDTMQIDAYKYLVTKAFLLFITPTVNIFQLDSQLT